MQKIYILIAVLSLVWLTSCKEDLMPGSEIMGDRILTVTANVPGSNPEDGTRSITQDPGSLDILLRWEEGNSPIKLVFKQGDKLVRAADAVIKSVAEEGKTGSFDVVIPQGIDTSQPFDLYGACARFFEVKDGKILVGINQNWTQLPDYDKNNLDKVPVWFEVKNLTANTSPIVNFQHLGSLVVMTVKNSSTKEINTSGWDLQSAAADGRTIFYESFYPQIDLLSNVVQYVELAPESKFELSIQPDQTVSVAWWGRPNDSFGRNFATVLNLGEMRSENLLPSRRNPLQIGKAYHLFALWDRDKLILTDEAFGADISGTTGILTWEFVDGTLTISGSGAMPDYYYVINYTTVPWWDFHENIKSIIIEDGVTSIGNYAFSDFGDNLKSVSIPNSVKSIGQVAFRGCSGLTSVTIPNSVTSIRSGTFSYCSALSKIRVEHVSPLSIPQNFFEGVDKATCILEVPTGSKAAYQQALHWKDFVNIVEIGGSDGNTGTAGPLTWSFTDGTLTISGNGDMPDYDEYNNNPTPWINLRDEINEVIIEDGVTSVGYEAFLSCKNLIKVSMANSVTKISSRAFGWCSKLEDIELPNSIQFIGHNAFSTTNLTSLNIPKSCEVVEGNIVYQSRQLEFIVVHPENVTYISIDGVLINKKEMKIIAYPNGKRTEYYTTPEGIKGIAGGAFEGGNSYMNKLSISEGIESIGSWAFNGMFTLKEVFLPASLIQMNDNFLACWMLQDIFVAEENINYSSVDGVFFNKSKDKLIRYPLGRTGTYTIPDYVTELEEEAFNKCKISDVIIPNTISILPGSVFFACENLKSIEIPESVTLIGDYAFAYSTQLVNIKVGNNKPPLIYQDTFRDINKNTCILEVPAGSKAAYQQAPYWSDFENIVEF